MNKYILLALALICCLSACTPKKTHKDQVIIQQLADVEMLNPYKTTDAAAISLMRNIFQSLLDNDYRTTKLVPVLAQSRPQVEVNKQGEMLLTFSIKPQAKWDNQSAITAKDVLFSFKVMRNPYLNGATSAYLELFNSIKLYEDDPLKITFVCKNVYIRAEYSVGVDLPIIPSYIYDPQHLMDSVNLKEELDTIKYADKKSILKQFVTNFDSEKYMRDLKHISGSGAYKIEKWDTGNELVLAKKENWWGDEFKKETMYFEANSSKLIYKTITDQTAALIALKAKSVDVVYGVRAKDFLDLRQSEKFASMFNSYIEVAMGYSYIGINMRLPHLQSKKTRKALAHLLDVDKAIKTVAYGFGKRLAGPILPMKKNDCDSTIKPYEFNIELAQKLLVEDGWKDTDKDGILDKKINGKKYSLKLKLDINAGNEDRKSVGLLFKEDARKAGIDIDINPLEWSLFLQNQREHKFDLYYGSWFSEHSPDDHEQIFGTNAIANGSNYVGFGNKYTDALIQKIKVELDPQKRSWLYKEFQKVMYEECPYIYIMVPINRIVISKQFTNVYGSTSFPGFWPAGFIAKE